MERMDIPNWITELTPMQIVGIIAIILVLLIFVIFFSIVIHYSSKTNKFIKMMPVYHSEGYIDIVNKQAIIIEVRRKGEMKQYTYDLDEFIYMISINPDSKPFRELCKIIRNGATKARIKKQMTSLIDIFMFIIDYHDGRRSLCYNNINKNQEFEDKIYFQINNNELLPEKKSSVKKDFLDNSLMAISDSEIFTGIHKEAKRLVSKGVTLMKISPKNDFLESNKDYLLNVIQLVNFTKELNDLGVKTFLSDDGSIYGIISNDRKRTHNSVQKLWINKIQSAFAKRKWSIEYMNTDIDDYNINTFVTTSKDSFSINEAMMFINIASEVTRSNGTYNYDVIKTKASEIAESSEFIIKQIKEKKNVIKHNKNVIEERGVKPFHELFLDFPKEFLDPVIFYSFKDKKDILEHIIKEANKLALKHKTDNIGINIDVNSIREIQNIIKTIKIKPNVHILISEPERIRHLKYKLEKVSNLLRENKVKTVQYIKSENGGNINVYRTFKPDYIMLVKGLNDSTVVSDKFKLNLKNIENIKQKEVKIINIQ